jgi:hypothetical protein
MLVYSSLYAQFKPKTRFWLYTLFFCNYNFSTMWQLFIHQLVLETYFTTSYWPPSSNTRPSTSFEKKNIGLLQTSNPSSSFKHWPIIGWHWMRFSFIYCLMVTISIQWHCTCPMQWNVCLAHEMCETYSSTNDIYYHPHNATSFKGCEQEYGFTKQSLGRLNLSKYLLLWSQV